MKVPSVLNTSPRRSTARSTRVLHLPADDVAIWYTVTETRSPPRRLGA
jgi:hypothetical protein